MGPTGLNPAGSAIIDILLIYQSYLPNSKINDTNDTKVHYIKRIHLN